MPRRHLLGHAIRAVAFAAALAAAAALLDVDLFADHVKGLTLFVLVAGTVDHLLDLVGLDDWARAGHADGAPA